MWPVFILHFGLYFIEMDLTFLYVFFFSKIYPNLSKFLEFNLKFNIKKYINVYNREIFNTEFCLTKE